MKTKRALVRGVPDSYALSIKPDPKTIIDVELAKKQHQAYCNALIQAGVELIKLSPDSSFPDCCFVEDTALVFENFVIINNLKASTRSGETKLVKEKFLEFKSNIYEIHSPGNIDGGDVLQIGTCVYIGLSQRTNEEGIRQVAKIVEPKGYQVVSVPIHGTLHLKTVCTNIGEKMILYAPEHFDPKLFQGKYQEIIVSPPEDYAANVLAVNNKVILSEGYPKIKQRLQNEGFELIEVPMSEFKKSLGSLTCLSVLL